MWIPGKTIKGDVKIRLIRWDTAEYDQHQQGLVDTYTKHSRVCTNKTHVMLCCISYIISYHIISYHIISHHIISYHSLYHIISYYIIQCHNISYHTIPYRTIPYHTIPYHFLYHFISYRIISYHIISYHIKSYIKYLLYHNLYATRKESHAHIHQNKMF